MMRGEDTYPSPGLTYLAVLAGVALRTGAVVLVWLSVHAGSSVDTRLMAAAVIQIWKAQTCHWSMKQSKSPAETLVSSSPPLVIANP